MGHHADKDAGATAGQDLADAATSESALGAGPDAPAQKVPADDPQACRPGGPYCPYMNAALDAAAKGGLAAGSVLKVGGAAEPREVIVHRGVLNEERRQLLLQCCPFCRGELRPRRAAHAARVIEALADSTPGDGAGQALEAINQPPGYRVRRPAGPAPDAPTPPPGGEVAVCGRVGDGNTLAAEGSERRPCAQCPEEVWVSPATLALKPERFLCTTCAVAAAGAAPPIKMAKTPRLSAVHRFAAAWADGVDLPPVGDISPPPSGLDERTLRWCGKILSLLLELAEGVDDASALALAIDRVSEFYARQHAPPAPGPDLEKEGR